MREVERYIWKEGESEPSIEIVKSLKMCVILVCKTPSGRASLVRMVISRFYGCHVTNIKPETISL